MNIGFLSHSLPLKWWDNTNIAHNKIFAWVVMTLKKETQHQLKVFEHCLARDSVLKVKPYCDIIRSELGLDAIVLFCGPFLPITPESQTLKNLEILSRFKGRVVYVTCDYLLQFDFRPSRYGQLTKNMPSDAFTRDKDWRYVLHAPFEHHFHTKTQVDKVLSAIPKENFISVPLNKAGIAPNHNTYFPSENPPIDLLYCGAYRQGRVEQFKRYFGSPEAQKWTISTSQPDKFRTLGVKCRIVPPFEGSIWKMINRSMAQLIISDGDSTDTTTPLPTRYWEALSAKSCVFFDESCRDWVSNSFNNLPRYYIEDLGLFIHGPLALEYNIRAMKADSRIREQLLNEQNHFLNKFNPYVEWNMSEWF